MRSSVRALSSVGACSSARAQLSRELGTIENARSRVRPQIRARAGRLGRSMPSRNVVFEPGT
eukprot:1770957-Alexandrium_andersonii.AAC.1